jgi:hypothetical protein
MVFTTELLLWAVCGRHVPAGERRPVDEMTLIRLAQAVRIYYMEYGALPSPTEYKTRLREHNIVEDETAFYSAPSGAEIRYFTSGNRFVNNLGTPYFNNLGTPYLIPRLNKYGVPGIP